MRILVTGANGYLGQGVVKRLIDDKVGEVIATDISDEHIDKRAIVKKANIFDLENPFEFLGNPDVVLHMAWRDGFKHSSLNHMMDLPKHYIFLSNMAAGGVKRICVMGSMHEVGFYEGSIDGNTKTKPLSLYGISKDALRNATYLITKENNVIFQWIRGFYIVGNSEQGSSIFSKIVQAANRGEKEFPFTSGTNQFDFLDYEEFCTQVAKVVEQDKVNGIINCCSGKPESLAGRVERFIKENGYDIKLKYGAFPDRPYDSKAIWGNDEKIRKIVDEG